ncbi:MFS transporter [Nonomuraea insulae]|uniref:MFS transporter n=1 Tax=Nonomuraea insulae TaxID=1616787 RepID=A0ABW1D3V5_9ACTN
MLGRYMMGAVAARTGDEMSGPALLVIGLAVTGSPVTASWLLAGLTVSAAVGGPVLGVLLDRVRRPGRLLGWCLAGYAAGILLVFGGLGRVPDGVLVGVAVCTGVLGPALTGGWTAQLPLVTGTRGLSRATALDSMSYNVAGLAGPALVGVIAAVGGGATAVLVSAGLLIAALPAAHGLPARDDVLDRRSSRSIRMEVSAGFAAIAGNGVLRRATVGSMVSCCGAAMVVVSAPVLGIRLSGESGHGALLLAVIAACGLAANTALTLLRRLPRWETVLAGGTAVAGIGMVTMGVSGTMWGAVIGAIVVGLGEGPQLTALFAVRHREAPERVRSQVFTTGASLKITSFAVGSALAGPLAAYSVEAAVLAGAVAQGVAVVLLIRWRSDGG